MDVKKHASRWVLLIAAFVVVCSATGRVLFANADGSMRGIHADPDVVYGQATPTNSQILSANVYRSATPTNSGVYSVDWDTPATETVSVTNSQFYSVSSWDTQVLSATPTNTQVLSVSEIAQQYVSEPEPEPTPQYVDYLPVDIPVTTVVNGTDSLDGFIYTLEYIGCAGDDSLAPDVAPNNTAAVAGSDTAYFETIYFREPGQYYFKVYQDRVNSALNIDKGYSWNDTWYFVGVRVEEGPWGLEPTLNYYEVGNGGMCVPREGSAVFVQNHS